MPLFLIFATGAAAYGLHWLFDLAGWQIALGFLLGTVAFYGAFRLHYGWMPDFNVDGEDDKNRRLPRL